MNNLEHTLKEAREDFDQCQSVTDLDQAKAKYLGKSGVLTEALKSLGKLSAEERPKVGAEINVVKQGVEEALEKRREAILNASQAKQLAEESLDVTLPSRKEDRGSLHPVTQTLHGLNRSFIPLVSQWHMDHKLNLTFIISQRLIFQSHIQHVRCMTHFILMNLMY